ncbi:hypothetical protein KO465_04240 [Candidatus Micrarchaeota archaeon]|jgi:hypothetical protein|nr:hypothetical protein [Candidatus Micrarchaeota archaeon]
MRCTHREQINSAANALNLARPNEEKTGYSGLRLNFWPNKLELKNPQIFKFPTRKDVERLRQANIAKDAIEQLSNEHYLTYLARYGSNSEAKKHVEILGDRMKQSYFTRAKSRGDTYNDKRYNYLAYLTTNETAHFLVLEKIIQKCKENADKVSKLEYRVAPVLSKTPKTIIFAVGDPFFAGMAMVLNPIVGMALTLTSGLSNAAAIILKNRTIDSKTFKSFTGISQAFFSAAYWWAGFEFAKSIADGETWPGVIAGALTISKAIKVVPIVFSSALTNTLVVLSKILPPKPEILEK